MSITKKILLGVLFLCIFSLSLSAQTISDNALVKKQILVSPSIPELNTVVTNNQFGKNIFSYPRSGMVAFDINTNNSTVRSSLFSVIDPDWNRMVYSDMGQDFIKSLGSFGGGSCQFKWPKSLVAHSISNGTTTTGTYEIYIADTYNDRVHKAVYNTSTTNTSCQTVFTGNGLSRPIDIAIDNSQTHYPSSDDEVWILNGDNKLLNFTGDGVFIRSVDLPAGCFATSLVYSFFSPILYVADTANDKLYRYDYNISQDTYVKSSIEGNTSNSIVDIDTDPFGHVWTLDANSVFTKYDYSLNPLCSYGSVGTGDGQFIDPSGFSIAKGAAWSADLFVTESWSSNSGIQHYAIGTDILNEQVSSNPELSLHYISYTLVDYSTIEVLIYDDQSLLVKTLVSPSTSFSGNNSHVWNGLDNNSNEVPTGTYTFSIKSTSIYSDMSSGVPVNEITKTGTFDHVSPCSDPADDPDNDRVCGQDDNCFTVFNPDQINSDSDIYGDLCDNCPTVTNADQADIDGDGIGDVCDECTDIDGDGFGDPGYAANTCDLDNCPNIANDQTDSDVDGFGDICDICEGFDDSIDADLDGIPDGCDTCPLDPNNDVDGDSVCGDIDNCPTVANSDQADSDGDGFGDSCEPPDIMFNSPGNNALNVSDDYSITVFFDLDIDPATLNNSSIRVKGNLSGIHSGTIEYFSTVKAFEFVPSNPFIKGEIVTVTLTDDIQSLYNGNLFYGYSWSYTIEVNPGPGLFMPFKGINATSYDSKSIEVADLDNDNDIDIVSSIGEWGYPNGLSGSHPRLMVNKNSGSNTYVTSTYETNDGYAFDVCAVDINNDGSKDIAAANYQTDNITVKLNNGIASFGSNINYPVDGIATSIAYADLDNNGFDDIITNSQSLKILYNNGGILEEPVSLNYSGGNIRTADINNDGLTDIITSSGPSVFVSFNLGSKQFDTPVEYYILPDVESLTAVDLNNDNYIDIIMTTLDYEPYWNPINKGFAVLVNNGDGTFANAVTYPFTERPGNICSADFDGDGDMDIALTTLKVSNNTPPFYIDVSFNNGDATFGSFASWSIGDDYAIDIVAADMTGDGHVDIVTSNRCSGTVPDCYWNSSTVVSVVPNLGDTQKEPYPLSYLNNSRTTNRTPLLKWTDYWFGEEQYVEITNGTVTYVSDPTPVLTSPQWTTPSLSNGFWTWKAKTKINGIWSNFSEPQTFEVYTYTPPPSCPVLYTFNGVEYEKENPLLTECEQYGYMQTVTDYYHVSNSVVSDNSQVYFQLREMEDETTYLDQFELITV